MSKSWKNTIREFPKAGSTLSLLVMSVLIVFLAFLPPAVGSTTKKILCLHGGDGTGEGFSRVPGMRDLEEALPDYEFVYADGGYATNDNDDEGGGRLWIPDPPGGKNEPTTDPAFSDASIQALDEIRESMGPFSGILGYSQGAAYVSVYLSIVPDNTFDFAVTFCGYPTLTHLGILEVVNEQSPFRNLSSLIWIGQQDFIIAPALTQDTFEFYESPTVVQSNPGGHEVPQNNDPTFDQVVRFIENQGDAENSNRPTIRPTRSSNRPTRKPSRRPSSRRPSRRPSSRPTRPTSRPTRSTNKPTTRSEKDK